jgi:FkbM family methyltransferase
MNRKVFRKVLGCFAGKKRYQRMFEILHQISLMGMNFGSVAGPEQSGEYSALKIIRKKLNPGEDWVLFDVGANSGSYAKLLQDVFGPKSKIYCFEPAKKSFELLQSNFGTLANMELINAGLGEAKADLTLYSNSDTSTMASIYHRRLDHHHIDFNQTEEVKITTVDDFCAENNIKHIHVLKIDVEGHEIKVIKGASNLIKSGNVDYIQFEFGGTMIDSKVFFQDFYYLLKDQYTIYRVVKDGFYEIKNYKELLEIFMASLFMAERKGIH